jgi:hypothetical protein
MTFRNRSMIAVALMALSLTANAGSNNGPSFFGDTTNNNQTYNQPVAHGGAGGAGGDASAIATGGTAFGGNASVGDIRNTNTNTALGGAGGSVVGSGNSHNDNTNIAVGGAGGKGGDANQAQGQLQGQQQGQGQHQSNVGVNTQGQSSSTSTSTAQGQSQDASSRNSNANNSSAAGNSTSVGGQSVSFASTYVAKRNAPGAYAPSVYPTATCQKSVSLGFSGLWGGGSTGMSYSDKECQTTVLAQNLAAIGMTDTACDVLKTSDTWARAVKANPDLANVSCRIEPAKAAVTLPEAPAPQADAGSKWKYHTVIEGGTKQ